MAGHGETSYTTADGNDYAAHEGTYKAFVKLATWGTIAVALLVALMAIFLT